MSERQFSRQALFLPTDTRGKPRVDDRRMISGIVHVLKSGARWADAPSVYGPRKPLYNRFMRWAAKDVWTDIFHAPAPGGPRAEVLINSSAVKAHRCAARGQRAERVQAIGRSRGGRTTKIHALTDRFCRPLAFLLTGGQVADCTAADALLDLLPPTRLLHGDKGYDTDAVRRKIEASGTTPNIPAKINRRWKPCFSPFLYRDRNAIERIFNCLKHFRRITTSYARLTKTFLATVCIAATVSYRL